MMEDDGTVTKLQVTATGETLVSMLSPTQKNTYCGN